MSSFLLLLAAVILLYSAVQLGKLSVYSKGVNDVYVKCQNFKTMPKLQIDVYADYTLAVYAEFIKLTRSTSI